jgi:nitrite reductase (NADH) small subunit
VDLAVMPENELRPGEVQRVVAGGRGIAVVRTASGQLYAVRDTCPHQGAPLSGGIVEPSFDGDAPGRLWLTGSEVLRCPWHHYEYCLKTGAALGDPDSMRVKTYGVRVVDGQIVLTV